MKDLTFNQLPDYLRNGADNTADITAGVGGFPVISIRGSRFRLIHQGEETVITDADGNPSTTFEGVIVKANKVLSKIYYVKSYEQGDDAAPDCFSNDGVHPDAAVVDPQSQTCAACPQNVWGSKITPQGTKVKACSDARRIAIAPVSDLACETIGSPALLRIPPKSFGTLAQLGSLLRKMKVSYYHALAISFGFDMDADYPKLTFKPKRFLTAEEFTIVDQWANDPIVLNIIGAGASSAPPVYTRAEEPQKPKKHTPAPPVYACEEDPQPEKPKKRTPAPKAAQTPEPEKRKTFQFGGDAPPASEKHDAPEAGAPKPPRQKQAAPVVKEVDDAALESEIDKLFQEWDD